MPILTGFQEDWLTDIKAAFKLLRTLFFFLKFFELYSKCFELYNYVSVRHRNVKKLNYCLIVFCITLQPNDFILCTVNCLQTRELARVLAHSRSNPRTPLVIEIDHDSG